MGKAQVKVEIIHEKVKYIKEDENLWNRSSNKTNFFPVHMRFQWTIAVGIYKT